MRLPLSEASYRVHHTGVVQGHAAVSDDSDSDFSSDMSLFHSNSNQHELKADEHWAYSPEIVSSTSDTAIALTLSSAADTAVRI